MNKKLIALILCVITASALALCACGSGEAASKTSEGSASEQQGGSEQGSTEQTASPIAFNYNGTKIEMKAPVQPILDALGEAKSYNEETSCAFEGLDKTYFYGSFYLYTYPQGEEDFVSMVELVDDTVETDEGICIGDSKEKVEEVYGADAFNGINAYTITSGDTTLTIIMDNDKVSSIQYSAVFE